jgi:hypothetical protein
VITSDIPTGKGGGEKANYFIIIVHLISSFIIGYHHRKCGFGARRLHHFIQIILDSYGNLPLPKCVAQV